MTAPHSDKKLTDTELTNQEMTKWFLGVLVAAILFSGAVILFIL